MGKLRWEKYEQCPASTKRFNLNGIVVTEDNLQCERAYGHDGAHVTTVNRNEDNGYFGEPYWFPNY